ncbi:MAG: hypothetical protein AAF591_23410 [Verrucomicrobiota bacterium]
MTYKNSQTGQIITDADPSFIEWLNEEAQRKDGDFVTLWIPIFEAKEVCG